MILMGAVLMSLRPHQIGTHDRRMAAKEALAAPTAMNSSPDPVRPARSAITATVVSLCGCSENS
jgi:hypothetical protein